VGMVAPRQRIASAFFVIHGQYGDVSRYAQERGVCRQWVYREAGWLERVLSERQGELDCLRTRVRELEERQKELERRLSVSVVVDADKQAEFASVAQARGVSLRDCQELLEVLIPGQALSVASLGRRTRAVGEKAGQLLEVLDEFARPKVRESAADEIYVKDPVLMVVEPESLCWITGRLSEEMSSKTWAGEFRLFAKLEQVTRDGGSALEKGVALVNAERQAQGEAPVVDQGDHFHALRGGSVGLHKAQHQARKALANAEAAQQALQTCGRQGQGRAGATARARCAWNQAEKAMDTWQERERLWRETKDALKLFTPTGELNTRQQAEAVLTRTLPQLPDSDFAKTKRQLQKPEMLNYLDRVEQKIAALPFPQQVKEAAVRQEGLRRRPEALQGDNGQSAALRGVMLLTALVLNKSGKVGDEAVTAIRDIIRRAYRASSLVECINSVLRMQQAGHRRMTQGLLDLKRLYWNCHRFRAGRRHGTTPYQRLGVPWPEGHRWWDVLKLTPEQLRDKLSTAEMAA
jgi:hypothetical protein